MYKTIDITPVGCKTPEGVKRVNEAMNAWQSYQADVANDAAALLKEFGPGLTLKPGGYGEEPVLQAVLEELGERVKAMLKAQDEFLKALAGR